MLSQESTSKAMSTSDSSSKSLDDVEIEIVIGTEIRKTSIFTLYAKIFRLLLTAQIPNFSLLSEELRNKELEKLILPSDEEWRHRVYHSLVELQREKDAEPAQDKKMEDSKRRVTRKNSQDWEWRPRGFRSPREKGHLPKGRRDENKNIVGSSNTISETGADGSMTEARIEPGWRINDILLAAKVLQNARPSPNYANEAEMRRVFGLVYDVLRYKNILNRTLEDGGFWYTNNALKQRERVVWLLLYDMQGRKFAHRRGSACETREKVFETVGLKDIEDALLKAKTHLAASISRLRISDSALILDELLPSHLRIAEGISWTDEGAIASGWINTMRVLSKNEFIKDMSKLKLQLGNDTETGELDENKYVFDPICPKMINLHDKAREKLAVSDLVRDHRFIFLERSLCLGAATLAQAIRVARLCGPVVLTHSIAPRHTGYLAGLLADIEDAGRLLAFGVGDRRCEYEAYLTNLGVTLQQCAMFSEKYISSPSSVELERATVVLATPPCSYTGVRDIVDLAVARGGDINLLESLTSDTAGGIKQPRALLAEQFSTLKYALTRPNIQFLIYEVHTILPSETTDMIHQVVEYANQLAMEKYIREHLPKRKTLSKDGKIPKSIKTDVHRQEQSREHWEDQSQMQHEQMFLCKREDEGDEKLLDTTDIVIPDSDLFEVGTIDEIYGETNEHMLDPGCFIAVIKRKEMMQFDSLFMIKVAESKGLFGDPDKQRNPKQKTEIPSATKRQTLQISRRGFKRIKVEIDRVAAPTHAWMLRATNKRQPCPRHSRHIVRDEKLSSMQIRETRKRDARRWWRDAITFLVDSKSHRNIMKDSQFYATRSDPFTQKPLYPFHAKKMPLKCHRRPRQRNLAFDFI
ncbi:Putative methyltransferase NSUN7 [Trachymyrmex septentrionalis]|uniref:Putative methyltransferase NSUN7 n=2 Tax=Trachymyrmex septentrionalis TaxID=34720 RepID=A0A151K120_9HYME|nr:Putative methyltransferase NSUN7 [Trachymyrmex septentrionalis]